jgi:hypothetical protein
MCLGLSKIKAQVSDEKQFIKQMKVEEWKSRGRSSSLSSNAKFDLSHKHTHAHTHT